MGGKPTGRPVLGKAYYGTKATQAHIDAYDRKIKMIAEAPTREELRDGRLFLVRVLPGAPWPP